MNYFIKTKKRNKQTNQTFFIQNNLLTDILNRCMMLHCVIIMLSAPFKVKVDKL